MPPGHRVPTGGWQAADPPAHEAPTGERCHRRRRLRGVWRLRAGVALWRRTTCPATRPCRRHRAARHASVAGCRGPHGGGDWLRLRRHGNATLRAAALPAVPACWQAARRRVPLRACRPSSMPRLPAAARAHPARRALPGWQAQGASATWEERRWTCAARTPSGKGRVRASGLPQGDDPPGGLPCTWRVAWYSWGTVAGKRPDSPQGRIRPRYSLCLAIARV